MTVCLRDALSHYRLESLLQTQQWRAVFKPHLQTLLRRGGTLSSLSWVSGLRHACSAMTRLCRACYCDGGVQPSVKGVGRVSITLAVSMLVHVMRLIIETMLSPVSSNHLFGSWTMPDALSVLM